ncbi:MAG: hypothetical protein ACKO5K_15680 [Armatimonadota bacterium]
MTLAESFLDYLDSRPPAVAPLVREAAIALCGFEGALLASSRMLAEREWIYGTAFLPAVLVTGGLVTRALVRAFRLRRAWERTRQVVSSGQTVTACVVRAHPDLYKETSKPARCEVVFSFDPDVGADPDYLRHLARRLAARLPESNVRGRTRLPDELTDGSVVYRAELTVAPEYLLHSHLATGLLTCMAEPGARGGIELVPYWLLFPFFAPVPSETGPRG